MSTAALAHDVKSSAPVAGGKKSLRVNRPGDAYEHEAERAAEQVMTAGPRRAAWSLSKIGGSAPLQRECSCGGTCDECGKKKEILQRDAHGGSSPTIAPAAVHDVLRGPGRPMDRGTRGFMEARFGQDFSSVRIFYDDVAASSAGAVAANAYTVGNKIVFNHGRYAPESEKGQRLLAHELAHVVQQQGAGAAPPLIGDVGNEAEAQSSARNIHGTGSTLKVNRRSGVGIARDPEPGAQLIEVKFPDGMKQLTMDQFAEYKRRSLNNLRVDLKGVGDSADYGRKTQVDTLAEYQGGVESLWDVVKKPKALIGIAADIKAGVTPPYLGMWSNPKHAVQDGLAACDRGDLATAARILSVADTEFRDAMHTWNAYREATIGGAEGVISNLETVRDVSFAVALAAGAAVAAPLIAGAVGATGATGAVATTATALGTGAVVGTGGAVLGGGSTAVGSLLVNHKIDVAGVKRDALKFGKQGLVTGLTAGLGTSLQAAAKGAKLAQPFVQAAAKRCLTEAGVNVAGEITTEVLDAAVPPPGAKEKEKSEGEPKPLLGPKARAALTGCVSGVMGVPVAKLGHAGGKAADVVVNAGVGFADAKLAGQSNKEAALAAAQNVLTSATIAHGAAGSEHAKAQKAAQQGKPASTAAQTPAPAPGEHASAHPAEPVTKSPVEKIIEKQKAATGHEGLPALVKEEAKAKAPIGDGHEAVVTEHGIGKCSPGPCPVIHVEFAKELAEHPWAKERYEEIQQKRKTHPEEAAKDAARFIKALEVTRAHAGKPSAAPFAGLGAPKGEEVFGEIHGELKLDAPKKHTGGIREAVADARKAGFVKADGSPGTVGGALQPHGSAPTVRDEFGIKGKDAQSAHVGPTAALKELSNYSRKDALTMLLPPEIHKAFDDHWKDWAHSQRRKGETHATVSELHRAVVAAIDQTPNMSPKTKGVLAWQLHMELFGELGLHPDAKIELPFKKTP